MAKGRGPYKAVTYDYLLKKVKVYDEDFMRTKKPAYRFSKLLRSTFSDVMVIDRYGASEMLVKGGVLTSYKPKWFGDWQQSETSEEDEMVAKSERETTITIRDGVASVFTEDPKLFKELAALSETTVKSEFDESGEVEMSSDLVHFGTPVLTGRKKSSRTYSDEERTAIGVRLQTAKATKFGLSLNEYKSLRLRPGVVPTKAQITQLKKARKTAAVEDIPMEEEQPNDQEKPKTRRRARRTS